MSGGPIRGENGSLGSSILIRAHEAQLIDMDAATSAARAALPTVRQQLTDTKEKPMTTKPTLADLREAAKTVRPINPTLADQICAEAEKLALPPEPERESVARSRFGAVASRWADGQWRVTGSDRPFTWEQARRGLGPMTVIWTPGDPDPRDVVQVPTDEAKDALENGGAASLIRDALEAHDAKFGGGL